MVDTHNLSEKFYQLQQSTSLISDADGLEIHLVNVLKSMLSCNSILVFHADKTRQLLVARNPFNLSQNESQSLTIEYDDPVGVDILVLRKNISRLNPQSPVLPLMHAELFAPLNSPDEVLGCIYVSRLNSKGFSPDDIKIVEHAAGLLARAVERQVWEKRLRTLQNGSLAWQKNFVDLLHAMPFPAMIVDKTSRTPDEANELAEQLFGRDSEGAAAPSLARILETPSSAATGREDETRVKIGQTSWLVTRRDIGEFDAEKTVLVFMPETAAAAQGADNDEHLAQFLAALESAPETSADISDFILQAAMLLQPFVGFDYFSITLIDEESGEAQPFVLCTPAVKDQLPAGSQWRAVEKTSLGWVRMADAQKEAADSVAGQGGIVPHNLPVHISFLLMHGETYLGNLALARRRQAPFDDMQRSHLRAASKHISKLLFAKKATWRRQAIEQVQKSFWEISAALEEAVDEAEIIDRLTQLAPAHLHVKDFYFLKMNEHEPGMRLSFLPAALADVVVGKKHDYFMRTLKETQRPVCVLNQGDFAEYFCDEDRAEALRDFAPFVIAPVVDAHRLYACFAFPWENEFPFHVMERHLLAPLARLLRDRILIARLRRRLSARVRESGRLMDIVTHDLSAPVFEMKGIASLLTQRYNKDLSGGAQEYLRNSAAGLESFEKLIAALAAYQKIDQPGKISDIDCRAIVNTAVARIKPQLPPSDIKIPPDFPPVRGNEEMLLLIFINLLANAAQSVENVPAPVIEIGVSEEENFFEFFVRDNGPAIDPSLQDEIFELFYKQENSKDASGLGLAIVKKAVHAHGGRLWLAAKKSGAEFHFTIPKELDAMTGMAPYSGKRL